MSKSDYIPASFTDKANWAINLADKARENKDVLELKPEEITTINENRDVIVTAVKEAIAAKATAKRIIDEKNLKIVNSVKIIRREVQSIKLKKGYTEGIGKDLGIIGVDNDIDREGYKPTIAGKVVNNHVVIDFSKKGIDGVHVYARLQGQAKWTFLATDNYSPYVDTRPLATEGVVETREYMCRGIIQDDEVGVDSDIISVVFAG